MSGAVVLLSGGIDSAAALWSTRGARAVSVHYGQTHGVELLSAKRIAAALGVPHDVVAYPMRGPSALTGRGESKVVPVRNLALITIGATVAAEHGCDVVVVGTNADDHADFPDCRPRFLNAVDDALGAYGIELDAPFVDESKASIVDMLYQEAPELLGLTWSCYHPQSAGARAPIPCGKCGACVTRARAFDECGISDPAER